MSNKDSKSFFLFLTSFFSPIAVAILLYTICSSTLLLINKIAIEKVSAPTFILWLQLTSSTIFVSVSSATGCKAIQLNRLSPQQIWRFIPAAFGFLGVMYANIKVLQHANVETLVVFRCSTPLILSFLDFAFLGRELPTLRSWISLLGILLGSVGYLLSQTVFHINALLWLALWLVFFLFEMTYLKHICDTIDVTNWSRVFYNNFIGLFPLTLVGIFSDDYYLVSKIEIDSPTILVLSLSCIVGLGMSYLSFLVRSNVSATSYTVIAIMCKLSTVVLSYFYWDKQATYIGVICLLLCLSSGLMYKQAPIRVLQGSLPYDEIRVIELGNSNQYMKKTNV